MVEPKLCNRLTTDLVVSRFGDHFFGVFRKEGSRVVVPGSAAKCCCGAVLMFCVLLIDPRAMTVELS